MKNKYKYQLQNKVNQYWKDVEDCSWNTEKEAKDFLEYWYNNYSWRHKPMKTRVIRLKYEEEHVIYF